MNIKFSGINGPRQVNEVAQVKTPQEKNRKTTNQQSDKVNFSSVLQDVNKANKNDMPQSSERLAKIESLKSQIAEGSYQPDLKKVAASLLHFIATDNKK